MQRALGFKKRALEVVLLAFGLLSLSLTSHNVRPHSEEMLQKLRRVHLDSEHVPQTYVRSDSVVVLQTSCKVQWDLENLSPTSGKVHPDSEDAPQNSHASDVLRPSVSIQKACSRVV